MEKKVFILDQTTIKKLLTVYRLSIPDFQRTFVWKQPKKQQLLESLFKGFPIGAITLYEDNNEYYIIDGLQRINTLNQYLARPFTVIPFNKFYNKIDKDVRDFIEDKNLSITIGQLKIIIKKWYEKLNNLYEFEKVSVLYSVFSEQKVSVAAEFKNLEVVEELLDILKREIEIRHDDIALIIYRGDKNDLPDLFKNINTGSVALSQYEILQSVWKDYTLDKGFLKNTFEAFNRELELIRNDYEIEAIKEAGEFDIFKNIMGINHIICCKEESDLLFKFAGYKKLALPIKFYGNIHKYFDNDSIGFEIYSTILGGSSNRIVKVIDTLYSNTCCEEEISQFVSKVNEVIIEAIEIAIQVLREKGFEMIASKYHSLYIIAGIVFSKYEIDINNLRIREIDFNQDLFNMVFDLESHINNKWFIDENRQISFFNIKVQELIDIRDKKMVRGVRYDNENGSNEILEIMINGNKIYAYSVKDFYVKVFKFLLDNNIPFEYKIPYATGNKRYLLNWRSEHIYGNPFVSPINIGDFYIETHKSKVGALRDIIKFLNEIDVNVE